MNNPEISPTLFIENLIRNYIEASADNMLTEYDNEKLFEDPVIGYADGDDPIFDEFKKDALVGDFHLTPREALSVHLEKQGKKITKKLPEHLSVLSAVFPFTKNITDSNCNECVVGSAKWNTAHHKGFAFMEECLHHAAGRLEEMGYIAVVPSYTKPHVEVMSSHGITSLWSEKHIAYAAGLGTFSLNGGLISSKGKAVGCCSLITDFPLKAAQRRYTNHNAYCLYYLDGSCRQCIERCPSGAITEKGYDSSRCFNYNTEELGRIVKESGKTGYPEHHIICGLCETKVPCERRIPAKIKL